MTGRLIYSKVDHADETQVLGACQACTQTCTRGELQGQFPAGQPLDGHLGVKRASREQWVLESARLNCT